MVEWNFDLTFRRNNEQIISMFSVKVFLGGGRTNYSY